MEQNNFFKRYEDYHVTLRYYEMEEYVSIEYLYQRFKERLLAELKEATNERHEG